MSNVQDVPEQQSRNRSEPRASRPHMPADYFLADVEHTLLPWSHARTRLEQARVYWIATTRPDGRPHVMPLWGVWLDDTFYFDGSPETRRGRNLAANPAIAVHLDSGGEGKDVVIVEGEAHQMAAPDREFAVRLAAAYAAKYASEGYEPGPETWDQGGLYVVRPRVAFAWTEVFKNSTRWHFEDRV